MIAQEDQHWAAKPWITQTVMAYVALWLDEATDPSQELAELVESKISSKAACTLDLSHCSSQQMRNFFYGVCMGMQVSLSRGAQEWHDASSFPEFALAFRDLFCCLRADKRLTGYTPNVSTVDRLMKLQNLISRFELLTTRKSPEVD